MRRSASWAAVLLAAAGLLYLLAVGTEPGQRLDDLAFEGRKATQLPLRRAVTALMSFTNPIVFAGAGAALVVLPWRRGRWRTAAGTLAAVVVAVGLARILKAWLPREQLLDFTWAGPVNSYPSGHSTALMALSLGLVTVAPDRWRGRVAAAAAILVVAFNAALFASGWHRPSDVLGALLLAAAVMALAAASVRSELSSSAPSEDAPAWFAPDRAPVRLLGVVSLVPLLAIVVVRNSPPNPAHSLGAFAVVVVLTNVVAVLLVWRHLRLVDGLMDPPPGER